MHKRSKAETIGEKEIAMQSVGNEQGIEMFWQGISYCAPSLKLWGYSNDLQLRRAIRRTLKKQENTQPIPPAKGRGK
jgi:hypothetical protein